MKTLKITLIILLTVLLTSCGGNSESASQPMTEIQQAEKYNLSMDEYKEMKEAAARMNMTFEEHMKGMGT